MPISMFDWPEQSQTSPIITFSNSDLVRAAHLQRVRTAGLHRGQGQFPFALVVGDGGLRGFAELRGGGFAGIRPAPELDRLALLQDHVAAEDLGQADFRVGG